MRKKLKIEHQDQTLALQIKSKEQWNTLLFQRRLDKIDSEIGIPISGCLCCNCKMSRIATSQVLMIALTLEVEGLEYENDRKGKHHEI